MAVRRHPSISAAVLAAVASASAACTTCPTTEVVRDDEQEITPARACAALDKTHNQFVHCSDVCDGNYQRCTLDYAFTQAWYATVDGGANDFSVARPCPAPPDGRATVKARCQETESSSEITWGGCSVDGRRPEGLVPREERGVSVGAYFAHVAHLEAASVIAFERLAKELEAHGAPPPLVASMRVACEDEIKHAVETGSLARRFGCAETVAPEAAPFRVRELLEIALENEVEGIVRETLGAALVTWRAEHAEDADVRAAMGRIAVDERRHAEIAFQLRAWIAPHLSDAEKRHLEDARARAIDDLDAELCVEPPPEVVRIAGAPRADDVRALIDRLREDLWSPTSRLAA